MAHRHSVYDTDLHFIIDPITRKISSQSGKVTLMQNDHNSERFTFEVPRYVEGHDMSLCNVVEVHYININSSNKNETYSGMYPMIDVQLSPDSEDVIISSWLISQNSTKYAGSLNFLLRFACIDEITSEIEYQWFTDVYSVIGIVKGIYNTDVITEDADPDILAAWKKEIMETVLPSLELAAEQYSKKAEVIVEKAIEKLNEVDENVSEYEKQIENTVFIPNFETGNLEYTSLKYDFDINEETGRLEWSSNEGDLEEAIRNAIPANIDEQFDSMSNQIGMFGTSIDDRFDEINDRISQCESSSTEIQNGVTTAQSTADSGVAKADAAQADVNALTTRVTTAETDIITVRSIADSGIEKADAAQTDVNALTERVSTAETSIATAQSTADTGVAKADAAQSTADTAVSNAATAQETANTAVANAAIAQSTADTGVTNAAKAQSDVNALTTRVTTAETNIATAQSTADSGVAKADAAQADVNDVATRLNALADCDDTTLDQLSEIVAYIKANRELIDSITTSKVSVSDIVDALTSTAVNKPLSANQGKVLNDLISALITRIESAEANIASFSTTISEFETTLNSAVEAINTAVAKVEAMETKLNNLTFNVNTATGQLEWEMI